MKNLKRFSNQASSYPIKKLDFTCIRKFISCKICFLLPHQYIFNFYMLYQEKKMMFMALLERLDALKKYVNDNLTETEAALGMLKMELFPEEEVAPVEPTPEV